jgi:general secretion pathway protein B
MSFILNALRKSEQERQARQAENVTDKILLPQSPQTGSKTTKLLLFLLIANVVVIAGIVLLLRNNATPTPDTTAHALPTQETKPEPKITDKPIQPQKQEQEAGPATISIAELIDKAKPEPAPLPLKPVITEKPAAEVIKKPAAIIDKSEPKPLTAPEIAAAIDEPDEPEATPVTPSIPFLTELPFEFRQSVPKFTVNVFVYSEAPEERFVMIDMVKYKTGQQIKDTMLLKEILPDSFVVDYQNRVFRIKRP